VTVIGPLIYWETERGTTARPSIDRVLGRPTANYFLIRALNTGTMSGVSNFVLTTATSASIWQNSYHTKAKQLLSFVCLFTFTIECCKTFFLRYDKEVNFGDNKAIPIPFYYSVFSI